MRRLRWEVFNAEEQRCEGRFRQRQQAQQYIDELGIGDFTFVQYYTRPTAQCCGDAPVAACDACGKRLCHGHAQQNYFGDDGYITCRGSRACYDAATATQRERFNTITRWKAGGPCQS